MNVCGVLKSDGGKEVGGWRVTGAEFGPDCGIQVPSGTAAVEPIRVMAHGQPGEPLRITVGDASRVTVIEAALCQGCERADTDTGVILDIGEGSRVDFHSVRKCAAGGRTASAVEAVVGGDASLRIVDCRLGGGNISSAIHLEAVGAGAKIDLRSLFFGAGGDRLELDYGIRHFASGTTSRIITRGVLGEGARAACRVKTDIGEGLGKVSGHEQADALLLSRDARFECAPELEIDSNDVRCGHGMTVSGLDAERLFYLMSRGLGRVTAMEAAARGFLEPVLVGISDGDLRSVTEDLLSARLRCAIRP